MGHFQNEARPNSKLKFQIEIGTFNLKKDEQKTFLLERKDLVAELSQKESWFEQASREKSEKSSRRSAHHFKLAIQS